VQQVADEIGQRHSRRARKGPSSNSNRGLRPPAGNDKSLAFRRADVESPLPFPDPWY
jgi:hypothetical protein